MLAAGPPEARVRPARARSGGLLSGGPSQRNHIHFVTWLVNDLKLDFMHAFILIRSLVFFILAEKLWEQSRITPFSN